MRSAVTTAEGLEHDFGDDAPAQLIVSPDGRIEYATPSARDWLDGSRAELLGRLVASMHAADDERLACCATVHGPVSLTTTYW